MRNVKLLILFSVCLILIPFTNAIDSVGVSNMTYGRVSWQPEVITSSTTTINNYTINGTEVVHNNLTGLQGGAAPDNFYHLTQALYNEIASNLFNFLTSRWLTSSTAFLFNDTNNIYFNDTLMNETIADYTSNITGGGSGTGIWTNDTDPALAEFPGNISIKNQIQFTDSNATLIVNETEFAIYI